MILLVDSGGTKATWKLIDVEGNILHEFTTIGFDPYFHSSKLVETELWQCDDALKIKDKTEFVFFYGAGCSSEDACKIIADGLQAFFSQAKVNVEHDLNAAAYSTYYGNPVISCILGTGSNSCFYDGTDIYEKVPSLAYILGDEASGSYFGKKLVQAYFYDKLPEDIAKAFSAEHKLSTKELLDRVYNDPSANVYLANFTKFLGGFKDHPYIKNFLMEGFKEFIDIHVKCFSEWRDVEVSFTGSVAFHFRDALIEACELEGITVREIHKKPIQNLIRYHVAFKIPQYIV